MSKISTIEYRLERIVDNRALTPTKRCNEIIRGLGDFLSQHQEMLYDDQINIIRVYLTKYWEAAGTSDHDHLAALYDEARDQNRPTPQ